MRIAARVKGQAVTSGGDRHNLGILFLPGSRVNSNPHLAAIVGSMRKFHGKSTNCVHGSGPEESKMLHHGQAVTTASSAHIYISTPSIVTGIMYFVTAYTTGPRDDGSRERCQNVQRRTTEHACPCYMYIMQPAVGLCIRQRHKPHKSTRNGVPNFSTDELHTHCCMVPDHSMIRKDTDERISF